MEEGDECPNCEGVTLRTVEVIDKETGRVIAKGLWCDSEERLVGE